MGRMDTRCNEFFIGLMNTTAMIGQKAPPLKLSEWVKGEPKTLEQLQGQVVLIECFQLNCPGCFLYGLPRAIDLYQRYHDKGLVVIGLATAFEDFDKNTLENLQKLVNENIVIGETKRVLSLEKRLIDDRLSYSLPFSVAMDNIIQQPLEYTEEDVNQLIQQYYPNYQHQGIVEKERIEHHVNDYLRARLFSPETFHLYQLQGTPSHIIIDKQGVLRSTEFGDFSDIEWVITQLLVE